MGVTAHRWAAGCTFQHEALVVDLSALRLHELAHRGHGFVERVNRLLGRCSNPQFSVSDSRENAPETVGNGPKTV